MLLPLSLMAMTPISDKDMSKVTGQAGVSMTFDLTLDLSFGQLGWGDSDGAAVGTVSGTLAGLIGGGWVGIDNLQISTLHIWPRTDYTMESTGTNAADGDWNDLKWLTIDVVDITTTISAEKVEKAFGTSNPGHITAVKIGVPTLTFTMDEMSGNVVLGNRSNSETIGGKVNGQYNGTGIAVNGPDFDQVMGKFYIGGLNMATGGGEILIAAHGRGTTANAAGDPMYGSGVALSFYNVTVSYLLLTEAAWGDYEGMYDASTINATSYNTGNGLNLPGWVGLYNLAIKNIVVNGAVGIDVGTYATNGTDLPGVWNNFASLVNCFDEAFNATSSQHGRSFVTIGLDDIVVTMDKLGATAMLSSGSMSGPSFGTQASNQVLGDIYVGGMRMAIGPNQLTGTHSWFAIFAH